MEAKVLSQKFIRKAAGRRVIKKVRELNILHNLCASIWIYLKVFLFIKEVCEGTKAIMNMFYQQKKVHILENTASVCLV